MQPSNHQVPSQDQYQSKSNPSYNSRDADYYLYQLPSETIEKLDEQDLSHIKAVIDSAIPKPSPKIIDLRFVVDLVITRYFVVLLIGKDKRRQPRSHQVSKLTQMANTLMAILLIIAMSLLISAVTILILYLIKSALGIDLFKGHINEVLFPRSR
ncbi:MAG: hypothetical protein NW214_00855 [Pseudanabaenaceae cyanobacterium bins.39]|nr:hypothetical protein [Pseudanabaenaceae cyanobacterium bins.39]